MSVVVGFSFPDEAIIISDSRISFEKNKIIVGHQDILRKIFPLTPYLAVGFTSNNVGFTQKILQKIQDYIKNQAKVIFTYPLLKKLPKVAVYEYKKLAKNNYFPSMEFVYAGILSDRMLKMPESDVINTLTQGGSSGQIPENIGKALMTMRDGMMNIEPPTPVVMKQSFPSGKLSDLITWGFLASGSGSPIEKVFTKKYYECLNIMSESGMRSNFIRLYCDDFIKESGIPTIGGGVQVLRLSIKGVKPVASSFKKIDNNGNTKDLSSMEFNGKEWIYNDYENGKKEVIKTLILPVKTSKSLI